MYLETKQNELLPLYDKKEEERKECECMLISIFWFWCIGSGYAILFYLIYVLYLNVIEKNN